MQIRPCRFQEVYTKDHMTWLHRTVRFLKLCYSLWQMASALLFTENINVKIAFM
jgi:hypothetical protein